MFSSDHTIGVHPKIMQAILDANNGHQPSYGFDDYTLACRERICEIFNKDVRLFIVSTGTMANALSLSGVCPPYGGIICDQSSHIAVDEAGAPEAFTHGAKLILTRSLDGKVTPKEVIKKLALAKSAGIHSLPPRVISLTQATERGEIYSPEEIQAISRFKNDHNLRIHMDGARFANAVVSLNILPEELTWKSGIDVMTLGATKNGAMSAECILFFDPEAAENFEYRQKRAGQLFSKMRFYSAQIIAYFHRNLWLENAKHANEMAQEVSDILKTVDGATIPYKTQANIVFAQLPDAYIERLKQSSILFNLWDGHTDPDSGPKKLYRFVTSYQTTQDDILALKRI